MSAGRYRGVFWAPGGASVPGTLEVSDSGELHLELLGRLQDEEVETLSEEWIEGELAPGPLGGPMVSLFNGVCVYQEIGPGGPLERWRARQALIGSDIVDPSVVFDGVLMNLRGLAAFLGEAPSLRDFEQVGRNEQARFQVDDWLVRVGWRRSLHESMTSLQSALSPYIEVSVKEPLTVDALTERVVPVFEAILTTALVRHARVEELVVSTSQGEGDYLVLGPRPEARRPPTWDEESARFDLLFRHGDMPASQFVQRVREVLTRHPEFTNLFLGNERAPPRYVEDRVRAVLLTLAHLTDAFPEVLERTRERLGALEAVPPEVRPFLPSARLMAVPDLLRELLTPGICKAFGVGSKEAYVAGTGPVFQWTTLREGEPLEVHGLLQVSHQYKALLHLALLRLVGFAPDDAEGRMVQFIKRRGIS